MKKQIIITMLGIILIANALAMYGGESITFETNYTNPVYTVVGNSSNLEGLEITVDNKLITISLDVNYKPDNYTIIFFDNITYEVEKIVNHNSGSGTRTKYVDKNVTVYVPEYVDKIKEIETIKTVTLNNSLDDDIITQPEGLSTFWKLVWIIVILLIFCAIGYYIHLIT